MTDGQLFHKFASDLCVALPIMVDVVEKSCAKLEKQASAIDSLTAENARLEASQFAFDEQKLYKAASAIHKACGTLSAEQLYGIFKNSPNAVLDSISKVASDAVNAKVCANLGTVRNIKKEASVVKQNSRSVDSRDLFMDIYNKNK